MNKTFIIGNLTRDPELRSVNGRDGPVSVCDFTVAVNRRNGGNSNNGQPDADFFRVTVWRGLADVCKQYLAKGRKVSVVGPVSCRTYVGNDGVTRASLEIQADDVEFLTPKDQQPAQGGAPAYQNAQPQYQNAPPAHQNAPAQQRVDQQSGFVQVEDEELPF
jgi:single-strand DNA-binding protein